MKGYFNPVCLAKLLLKRDEACESYGVNTLLSRADIVARDQSIVCFPSF